MKNSVTSGQTISISEIASRRAIPVRFLEAILRDLKDAGIAISVRGKDGGYKLSSNPSELRVGDIVRIFSPQEVELEVDDCIFKSMVAEASRAFYKSFDQKNFKELASEEAEERKVINFSI